MLIFVGGRVCGRVVSVNYFPLKKLSTSRHEKSSLVYCAASPEETNTPDKSVCPHSSRFVHRPPWQLSSFSSIYKAFSTTCNMDRIDCLISTPDPAGKNRYQYTSVKDMFHCKTFLQEIHRSPGTEEFHSCTSDNTLNNYTSHFTKHYI